MHTKPFPPANPQILLLQNPHVVGDTNVVLLKLCGRAPASISLTADSMVWISVSNVTFSFSARTSALNESRICFH